MPAKAGRWIAAGCVIALWAAAGSASPAARPHPGTAVVVEVRDAIGPPTSRFFIRTLRTAGERRAVVVILQLDTPGGLDSAMRDMVQAILASPTPVVAFVAPSGARAASAGTFLLMASHIAAMAPATNLGAATPVPIGRSPSHAPAQDPGRASRNEGEPPAAPADAPQRKAVNDAVAYIRGLAELRHRNTEWAEAAVREAASLSATQALEQHVIDVIARDIPALLAEIDGREVVTAAGKVALATRGLTLERIEPDWRTRLLAAITDPNVAYLLMLIGIYGLLLEGYSPGAVLPGVVGAICLLLAMYAFQILAVNYVGLGFILLGTSLIVAEAFAPSFGALGVGGIVAFVIGSLMLFEPGVPGFEVSRPLIGMVGLMGSMLALALAIYGIRTRRRPVVTGRDALLRELAIAIEDFEGRGMVRVRGEIWQAQCALPVRTGERLRIRSIEGLILEVEPAQD